MAAAEPLVEQNYNNYGPHGPLNQHLILKKVLEHVGKANKADIKNCRLVSHSWNRAAVFVLEQQYNSALEFEILRLLEFKHLLWNTELSRTKEADQQRELTSLRLSLTLNSNAKLKENLNSGDSGRPGCREEKYLSEISMAAQLLMLYPHISVVAIHCTFETRLIFSAETEQLIEVDDGLVNRELFSLLRLSSHSLIGFRLTCYKALVRPNFGYFDFDSYNALTFPKLTILFYQMAYDSEEGGDGEERNVEMLDLTRHVIAVTQGAPILGKLSLDIWEGSVEGTANSVRGILEGCSAHLEQLNIEEGDKGREDIFKALTELQFPFLKLVKTKNGLLFTNSSFNQFLTHSCPALTGLELEVEWSGVTQVAEENEDSVLEFPLLPKVVHLDLQLLYCVRSHYFNLQRVHLTFTTLLRNLPSLTCLTIDLGVLFMLGAHLRRSGQLVPQPEQYPVFPNICSLEICIREVREKMLPLMDMCSRIYQHTFPNMEKLVIKPLNESMSSSSREVKQRLARAIEFVCLHPGIRALEIHNYASDWMNQIVNSRDASRSLEGLKSLKLLAPNGRASRRTPPQMKLMELLTRFPSLEFLQFGKQVASQAELESVRGIVKKFEQPISN